MSDRYFKAKAATVYESQSGDQVKTEPRKICKTEPVPCGIRGSENYYVFRFNDFLERHQKCNHIPPTYYYGSLKNEVIVRKKIEELKSKDYSITLRFPIPIGNLQATIATTVVNPQNISNGRELWIGLESELVKRLANIKPVKIDQKNMLPDITESYGYKYCVAFGLLLRPKLTFIGQAWIDKTLILLQEYMEQGLVNKRWYPKNNRAFIDKYKLSKDERVLGQFYTNIELDSDKFKDFAFATHPDAYLDGGLNNLPIEDLVRVGITPDFAEWKDMSTIDQAIIVGKEVVPSLARRTFNYLKEGFSVVVTKLGEWDRSSSKHFY